MEPRCRGIDALIVTIEVAAEKGVSFALVGMADTAVRRATNEWCRP